jgi:hypothetical protein
VIKREYMSVKCRKYNIGATSSTVHTTAVVRCVEIKMTDPKSTMTTSKVQSTMGSIIYYYYIATGSRNNVLGEQCTFSYKYKSTKSTTRNPANSHPGSTKCFVVIDCRLDICSLMQHSRPRHQYQDFTQSDFYATS